MAGDINSLNLLVYFCLCMKKSLYGMIVLIADLYKHCLKEHKEFRKSYAHTELISNQLNTVWQFGR